MTTIAAKKKTIRCKRVGKGISSGGYSYHGLVLELKTGQVMQAAKFLYSKKK